MRSFYAYLWLHLRMNSFLREVTVIAWCLSALQISPEGRAALANLEARRDETVRVVERVMPAVVNISSKAVVRRRGFFFDWWRDNWSPFYQELPPQYSVGSGVIIDEEGYILTNVHVVEDATEIVVTLADKRSFPADLVVGTRKSDVALLKIRAVQNEKFVPVQFAADDDLLLGEPVIALGNPFGLGGSVSKGILSSKTRRTSPQEGILDMEDWIQTDAAINPGNSGGPLINLEASLIGLNVAVFKEGQGIGFAIPVKRVAEALGEIFTPETLRSLWFGAQFKSTTNGLAVVNVVPGSPAETGGLREGDMIARVNGISPKSAFVLNREVMSAGEKKEVSFQLRRGGALRNASVKLVPEQSYFNAKLIREKIGVSLRQLTEQDSARLGVVLQGGFVVTGVDRGSPADHSGFQQGLIIETVDGQRPDSLVSFAKILARKKRNDAVRLTLIVPGPFRRAELELKVR
ncbi:MAG TPA: trypsin-like peptidase domain-containing protein [Verrucomicrobiae bacterium]|nr:trypsin-like peptidase domain-containing protein [Verrucomicrobiae bacterium]